VILSLDGQAVTSPDDLLDLLTADRVGKAITLGILRGGSAKSVPVTVGERGAS
jgi:putative serine protease PepD